MTISKDTRERRRAAPASLKGTRPRPLRRARKAPAAAAPPKAGATLAAALRVLRLEAAAIESMASALDDSFVAAIDRLQSVAGRVVVSGMGKSGHVARKVSATLASTGTPSFYIHPAEASHGDLGMITREDAVLALSNSGETRELADLIDYSRRFTLPLIAITGRAQSSLAEAADIALLLPNAPEACPLGLAPTTSTTMMLALGDALAIALLERKGFSADAFQLIHPGGQIGRRLLRVADLMHRGTEVPVTRPEARMTDAILTMTAKRFGCVGVIDARGRLVGVITDGDLRRHMGGDLLEKPVQAVMTRGPQAIRPKALAAEALGLMNAKKITSLFVVERGRPVGILHIHDCLRAGIG